MIIYCRKVVKYVGISEEELARLKNPEVFERPESAVPQPALDTASNIRMAYPEDQYAMMVSLPDEVLTEHTRESAPPTDA